MADPTVSSWPPLDSIRGLTRPSSRSGSTHRNQSNLYARLEAWHNGRGRKARLWRSLAIAGVLLCALIFSNRAAADPFRSALRAFAAHEYARAVPPLTDLAAAGDPRAQTYLGYMFLHGLGVPQSFIVAAGWYRCASRQGVPQAQFQLGLLYDKGQGVPQDYIMAYALLNLAVAGAGPARDHWVIVRDAVASKLSLIERVKAQQMAFEAPPQGPCLPIVTGH